MTNIRGYEWLTDQEIERRKQLLKQAKMQIEEASQLIYEAVENVNIDVMQNHAEAYIIPHLLSWSGDRDSNDTSIVDMIDKFDDIKRGDYDDEPEEDEDEEDNIDIEEAEAHYEENCDCPACGKVRKSRNQ